MPNFGYELLATANVSCGNTIFGVVDTCPEAGLAQSITVYLYGWAAGEKVKCALYDANEDFVAETEERTTGGATDWYTFEFSSPPSLTNQDYTIVAFGDSEVNVKYIWDETPGYGLKYGLLRTYGDGFPASCAGGSDYDNKALSIYCTYETAPPPAAKTLVQAALISIPPLIVLPTLGQILRFSGAH